MKSSGVVKDINGNEIVVSMYRDSACSHCDKCSEESKMGSDFSIKTDRTDIAVGDIVTFEMEDTKLFKAAFIVYLLPIVALFIGYYVGVLLNYSEGGKVLMTFLFLLLSFLALHIYDKKIVKARTDESIQIISVDKKGERC